MKQNGRESKRTRDGNYDYAADSTVANFILACMTDSRAWGLSFFSYII